MILKNFCQRTGIAAGGIFYNVQPGTAAQLNIRLKLTTKSQIETRLPELKYSDANSQSSNVPTCSNTHVGSSIFIRLVIQILSVQAILTICTGFFDFSFMKF